jgi:hypothetical protein
MPRVSVVVHAAALILAFGLASCGGSSGNTTAGNGATSNLNPAPPAPVVYTVGGAINGLANSGLTLQDNGGDNLVVASGGVAFTFDTSLASGAAYAVTVLSQPSNENCTVANGSGAVGSTNVANIVVTCSVTTTPPSSGASSFDNIDAALAAGSIDAETALTYKVFATFGDARLPSQYQGDNDGIIDTPVMDQVAAQYDSLSPTTQSNIGPFLLRPSIQGSWGDAAMSGSASAGSGSRKFAQSLLSDSRPPCKALNSSEWAFEDRDGIPVRVWYTAADAATAVALADEIHDKIWPAFVAFHALGAPLPVDDTNSGPTYCFGGDSKLDIYLVALSGNEQGLTVAEGSGNGGPVFILLKHDHAHIGAGAAHEIMHAVQWAVTTKAPQLSYGWLRDATANWAVDMVYGNDSVNFEHGYADCYMTTPELSLDDRSSGHCKFQPAGIPRDYGAYLYIQFLAKTSGGNAVVAQILNAMASTDNGQKAVDAVSPFKDHWPDFAKLLWNQDPVNVKSGLDSFKNWDSLTDDPATFPHALIDINLQGQPSASTTLEGNIKHLAIHYFHYQISDPNVRSLIFYNHPYAVTSVGNFKVSTQAFFKIGGVWDYAHWSKNGKDDEAKPFCLDVKAERFEELVIALSNDSIDQDITGLPEQPRLSVSNVGCWKYQGTTGIVDNPVTASENDSSTVNTTGVTFQNVRYLTTPPQPSTDPGHETFKVVDGTVNGAKTEIQTAAACTIAYQTKKSSSDPGPDAPLPTNDASSLDVQLGLTDPSGSQPSRAVSGKGSSNELTHRKLTCSGVLLSEGDETDAWDWLEFPAIDEMKVEVQPDGSISINPSFTHTYTGSTTGTRVMSWNLKPQREP